MCHRELLLVFLSGAQVFVLLRLHSVVVGDADFQLSLHFDSIFWCIVSVLLIPCMTADACESHSVITRT